MQWSSWLINFVSEFADLVQAVFVSILALLAALGLA